MDVRTMPQPPRLASNAPIANAGPEVALVDYLERLGKMRAGRIALYVHLSRLQAYNRRLPYLRVAEQTFEAAVSGYEGQLFVLKNGDMVFIVKDMDVETLEEALAKLRYLFDDDPLTELEALGQDQFASWYWLEEDYETLLAQVRQLVNASWPGRAPSKTEKPRPAISPALLGRLEEALAKAEISSIIRQQPIYAFLPGQPLKPILYEVYVSVQDIETNLLPGVDLLAERWLFQYLTQTLDRRVLATLMRDFSNSDRPFSVNLNVASLLSAEFNRFDIQLSPALRGRLVIELQLFDVVADLASFYFARDFLRERGYRLCLDGLSQLSLLEVDRDKLGFDLLKLNWSPELADMAQGARFDELKSRISAAGPARVILHRCEDERAVLAGRRLGIALFQGRFMSRLAADGFIVPGTAPGHSARRPS
jgi:EAL domain-containing protein (putative c-di-GMP-specific phosphodiesterase class I)